MKTFSPAGMSVHGFFGYKAKTLGNPDGKASGNGAWSAGGGGGVSATFNQWAKGTGGYLAGGIFNASTGNPIKSATRFAATPNPLAAPPDTVIGGFNTSGIQGVFFANNLYVVSDNAAHIATSSNGSAWTLATYVGTHFLEGGYAFVFDDVNNVYLGLANNGAGTISQLIAPLAAPPLNFNESALPANLDCIGYRPGSGVILGLRQGAVWRTANGGTTWTHVGNTGFTNAYAVLYGSTQWVAFGGNGGSASLASTSTDNGVTWSAPVTIQSVADAVPSVGTDGAGNWVVIYNFSASANNYAISNDDGATWSTPGLFLPASQGGWGALGVFWDGLHWNAIWSNAALNATFFANSLDGKSWAVGPTITD